MAAYAIFIREETRDPAEMAVYTRLAGPTLAGHDAKVLAAYGPQQVLEGDDHEGVVIVQFPSLDAARAWYDGDEYKAAREHRFRGARYRAVIVEGLS